jgi:hypothetical protein
VAQGTVLERGSFIKVPEVLVRVLALIKNLWIGGNFKERCVWHEQEGRSNFDLPEIMKAFYGEHCDECHTHNFFAQLQAT